MEHVVFFPAHDGSPAFRRVATLEQAVGLVEHLRNVEGVNDVTVHALTEVPLEFKAYYRVEMPGAAAAAPVAAPVVPAEEPATGAPAVEPVLEAAVLVEAPPVAVPEQPEQPAAEVPQKASLGFFSRG